MRSHGRASAPVALCEPAITEEAIRRCHSDRADFEGLGQVANRRQAMAVSDFSGLKRRFDRCGNGRGAVAPDAIS